MITEVSKLNTVKTIAPHEALEIHELVEFKNLCATKSATMSGLVKDEELKNLLQQDFTASQGHIKALQNLMQGAGSSFESTSNTSGF
jgi:similar to spore coat protein